ncbi:MAG TPA: MarR family transcriptional regulator [Bradyrhizobium sp.]
MKPALSRAKARAALMQELEHAVRKSSGLGVIFGQTVANAVGISSSDLECLDFLNIEGRVTAGRLAELTGLTTGAITGLVDRMEKAGLVRRERDEADRRKVYIAIVPDALGRIGSFYEPLQKAVTKNWEGYTDAELKLLLRFMTEGYDTMLGVLDDLKTKQQKPAARPSKPARK